MRRAIVGTSLLIFLLSIASRAILAKAASGSAAPSSSAGLSFYAPYPESAANGGASAKSSGGLHYQQQQQQVHQKCDRITVALCQDTPYNYTRMPNMLGHYNQDMVSLAVQEYKPLIEVQCSEHLKFFLCSIFTPMCTDTVDVTVTSCRSVCEEVKRSCLPLLKNFGFSWPEMLNCSQFPTKGSGAICMDPLPESESNSKSGGDKSRTGLVPNRHVVDESSAGKQCPPEFIPLASHADSSKPCALNCDQNWMFKAEHKQFASWWMGAWSIGCIVVTAFTVVTFCLDTSRFRYPERSIVFLSICYNLYAWGYVLRLIFGPAESACQQTRTDGRFLIVGGLDNPKCVIVFMILYYFGTASAIWWVVLTFTWFLAAAHKWGQEAIAAVSSYFHLAAWGVPALLTIAVLITHQVDASELTGLCFVGQHNSRALLGFVIAPMTLFLITGVGFIVAGFAAMIRIRQEIRNRARDMTDLNKLEKLMVKIGIFAMLYVLPALTVIGCSFYEKAVLDQWSHTSYASFCSNGGVLADHPKESSTLVAAIASEDAAYHRSNAAAPHRTMTREAGKQFVQAMHQLQGHHQGQLQQHPASGDVGESAVLAVTCLDAWLQIHSRPKVDVYILKIFMTLIVGITSGMWVWSRKTCATWQRRVPCCNRFCVCCRLFSGPTGAKTLVQYAGHQHQTNAVGSSSSAAAVGVPLLASATVVAQGQAGGGGGQQSASTVSSSYPAHHHQHHQQYASAAAQQQQSQRAHLLASVASSSYHRQNRHQSHNNPASSMNVLPMQSFGTNGANYGFPSTAYTTTASSEASAKI